MAYLNQLQPANTMELNLVLLKKNLKKKKFHLWNYFETVFWFIRLTTVKKNAIYLELLSFF